jgi:hypothetical protein
MVEKTIKKIEIPMIKLEIEVSELFFDDIEKGMAIIEETNGRSLTHGEYLENTINGLLMINNSLTKRLEALGYIPPVKDKSKLKEDVNEMYS